MCMKYVTHRRVAAGLGALLLLGGSALLVKFVLPEDVRRPIVDETRGLLVALRRLADVPLSLSARLRLLPVPIYRLVIDPADQQALDEYFMLQEGNLNRDKLYVPAVFYGPDGERFDVEVSHRGDGGQHFRFPKKSWRIVFPDETLFKGMKAITLIYPEERGFLTEAMNYRRAKQLGLATPDTSFVYLFINRHDAGLYYEFEHWTEEMLERNGLTPDGNLYGEAGLGSVDLYRDTAYWNQYVAKAPGAERREDLALLLAVLNHPSDDYFYRRIGDILDLDSFYRWNVHALLSGSPHQDSMHNIRLYFDPTQGKCIFLAWDVGVDDLENPDPGAEPGVGGDPTQANPIARRILAEPRFLAERNALLSAYLTDTETVARDMAYYDELYRTLRPAFLRDPLKNHSNNFFKTEVARIRDVFARNISFLTTRYAADTAPTREQAVATTPPGIADASLSPVATGSAFAHFHDIGSSPYEFAARHPAFQVNGRGELSVGPGAVVLRGVTVVPKHTRLHIAPGTDLYLERGASLVSYSAIEAVGTALNPIRFLPLEQAPWGTLAIIGAPDESRFEHVFFLHTPEQPTPPLSLGEHRTVAGPINGMMFRGMVTVRHAAIAISASTFKHAAGDDALNVQYGAFTVTDSLFLDNSADAFDADVASGSIVRSAFRNSGNDGIDFDATRAHVEDVVVDGSGDKGLSLGVGSELRLTNSLIRTAAIGVAVKDDSAALITNATIVGARTGVALYQDNPIFPDARGTATVTRSVITKGAPNAIAAARGARLVVEQSLVEDGFSGAQETIVTTTPQFRNAAAGDYRLVHHAGDESIGLQTLPKVPR